MSKLTNDTAIARNNQRINGIKEFLTAKTEVPIDGEMLKSAQIVQIYQDDLDARAAVTAANAARTNALSKRTTASAKRASTDKTLKGWVIGRFGADSKEAHTFGYAPPKVPVKSAETKAQAARLNLATREARHTMGPKAKLKIKGTLPATEASTAPAEAPVASPAPAAQAAPIVAASPAPAGAPTAAGGGTPHS